MKASGPVMSDSILVTGAAGFIASHLVDSLLARGYRVIGVDNLFRGSLVNLSSAMSNEKFQFLKINLSDAGCVEVLDGLISKFNVTSIFHLAAINGTEYFYDASWMVLDENVRITQNVLRAAENPRIQKVIYTSSSEVYGDPVSIPTDELHPVILNSYANRDSYASSKALGDFYVKLYAEKCNRSYLILRIFNQYGPRMQGNKYGQVVGEFIRRALHEKDFTIIGNGSHTRSFCYVQDAASIMIDLFEKNVVGFINLGTDQEVTILDLAMLVHHKLGKSFSPVFLPERVNDHKRRCPDIAKLKMELGHFIFTSLEVGLEKTIKYFIENNNGD